MMRFNRGHAISAAEREQIIWMLKRLPLPDVKEKTGRSYLTLARMADAAL